MKQNKCQKTSMCVCITKPIKAEQWMNECYININTFMSHVRKFSYTIQYKQQPYWRNKKNGNIKKWKENNHTEMKLMWQWIEFWRHVVYCTLFYYIMAWYLLRAVSSPFQFFAWPLFSLLLLPLLLLLLLLPLLLWCFLLLLLYVCDWLFLSGFFPFDLCNFFRAHSAIFSCITENILSFFLSNYFASELFNQMKWML